ncbi:hypothetical protein KBC04_02205 [Candidatus Babeliales bacterium]|nr:hypothetical protein [Candidatus Babeliales bacterium]MBP9843779.1 hypothetical protein [Candidatus Babeliales bacterium]
MKKYSKSIFIIGIVIYFSSTTLSSEPHNHNRSTISSWTNYACVVIGLYLGQLGLNIMSTVIVNNGVEATQKKIDEYKSKPDQHVNIKKVHDKSSEIYIHHGEIIRNSDKTSNNQTIKKDATKDSGKSLPWIIAFLMPTNLSTITHHHQESLARHPNIRQRWLEKQEAKISTNNINLKNNQAVIQSSKKIQTTTPLIAEPKR